MDFGLPPLGDSGLTGLPRWKSSTSPDPNVDTGETGMERLPLVSDGRASRFNDRVLIDMALAPVPERGYREVEQSRRLLALALVVGRVSGVVLCCMKDMTWCLLSAMPTRVAAACSRRTLILWFGELFVFVSMRRDCGHILVFAQPGN